MSYFMYFGLILTIPVNNYASIFYCTPAGRASDSMMEVILVGWGWTYCLVTRVQLLVFFCCGILVILFTLGVSRCHSTLSIYLSTHMRRMVLNIGGGGARFRILGEPRGANSQQAHDVVMTSM